MIWVKDIVGFRLVFSSVVILTEVTVCRAVFGPPSKLEGVATKLRYSQTSIQFFFVLLGGAWRQCFVGGREEIARREVSFNEQVEYRFIEARSPEEQAEASRHSSRHILQL